MTVSEKPGDIAGRMAARPAVSCSIPAGRDRVADLHFPRYRSSEATVLDFWRHTLGRCRQHVESYATP